MSHGRAKSTTSKTAMAAEAKRIAQKEGRKLQLKPLLAELKVVVDNIKTAQNTEEHLAKELRFLKGEETALQDFRELGKSVGNAHRVAGFCKTREEKLGYLDGVSFLIKPSQRWYFDLDGGLELYRKRVEEMDADLRKSAAGFRESIRGLDRWGNAETWIAKQEALEKEIAAIENEP